MIIETLKLKKYPKNKSNSYNDGGKFLKFLEISSTPLSPMLLSLKIKNFFYIILFKMIRKIYFKISLKFSKVLGKR